jgi:hypothetical protein
VWPCRPGLQTHLGVLALVFNSLCSLFSAPRPPYQGYFISSSFVHSHLGVWLAIFLDAHLHLLIPSAWHAYWIFFVASLCYLSVLELMADCAGLWFWNLLPLYYRLVLHSRHRTLEPGLAGTGTGTLWVCNISRGSFGGFGGHFGMPFLEYRVSSMESGNLFSCLYCV